ncbi:sialidase family protein [Jiangella endophytica]|uniref:sialidase family protein n=1 Tax=Jiangella endophytica TaxID=1623398 RepID=UPI000E347803|nr:sialidase family protein [Jiangella endophytica]
MTDSPAPTPTPTPAELDAALASALRSPSIVAGAELTRFPARFDYGMTLGIDATAGGRLWSASIAGGDNHLGFVVLRRSDDGGCTWSDPVTLVNAGNAGDPLRRRSLVAAVWVDPRNRLWLFVDQSVTYFDGRAGTWALTSPDADADTLVWSTPRRIGDGALLNKPIVLADGSWVAAGSLWDRTRIEAGQPEATAPWAVNPFRDRFGDLDEHRGAWVRRSRDEGRSWEHTATIRFEPPEFDEPRLVQRTDSALWLTARIAAGGLAETIGDPTATLWEPPRPSPGIRQPSSRHALERLRSGALLLVKNGSELHRPAPGHGRSELTAYLSHDDGATWTSGLLLDGRSKVSYPDIAQLPDGRICVSYDHNRRTDGQVLLARFTEDAITRARPDRVERSVISQPDPAARDARLHRESTPHGNA